MKRMRNGSEEETRSHHQSFKQLDIKAQKRMGYWKCRRWSVLTALLSTIDTPVSAARPRVAVHACASCGGALFVCLLKAFKKLQNRCEQAQEIAE